MHRRIVLAVVLTVAVAIPNVAAAATYYIGAFDGSTPRDDATCGTGKSASPDPHPCATLAYWTQNRRSVLANGDTVRMTGTLASCGSASCDNQCIVARHDVTYEGRNSNDTPATSAAAAIVDGKNTTGSSTTDPCYGSAFNGQDQNFTNLTLRYVTLQNARRTANATGSNNISINDGTTCGGPDGSCSGLVFDHIRVTQSALGGLSIGDSGGSPEDNPCNGHYRTTNVTILDSEFDHNNGTGLTMHCVDGFTVRRSTFHDNYDQARCNPNAPACNQGDPCEGQRDGFFFGSKNGLVEDVESYRNGQDQIDLGGVGCAAVDSPSHDIVMNRVKAHDALCGTLLSYSHGAYNVTTKNSWAWGRGAGINQKSNAYKLKFYNNTFWITNSHGAIFYSDCRDCDVRNNIFVCTYDGPQPGTYCINASPDTTAPGFIWDYNVVSSRFRDGSPAPAFIEATDACNSLTSCANDGNDCGGGCECPARNAGTCSTDGQSCCFNSDCTGGNQTCQNANCDPQHPGYMPGWNTPPSGGTTIPCTAAGLARFGSEGATGAWFGPESGAHDLWGAVPDFVSTALPMTAAGLHLKATDTVAHEHGTGLSAALFGSLLDGDDEGRPVGASWDIGADQIGGGAPALGPPQLLTVEPLP